MSYHRMLSHLKEKWPEGRGIQEFVRILHLHKDYPAELLEQAIEQELSYGCVHLDSVLHCLRLTDVKEPTTSLDLSDRPDLDKVGNQPVDLSRYERLLKYNAKFPIMKELGSFDFSLVQGITKNRVLELSQSGYLSKAENVILIGNPGLGKSHIATGNECN